MLRVEYVYWLVGAFFAVAAVLNLRGHRRAMAAFWAVLAGVFVFGDAIQRATAAGLRWPAQLAGLGVIALGLLSLRESPPKAATEADATAMPATARVPGNRLFAPALAIPFVTLLIVLGSRYLRWGDEPLIDATQPTLTALGIACVAALLFALRTTRAPASQSLVEGRRLLDTVGCVAALPMLLATLGSVFAATGVGDAVAGLVGAVIPTDDRLACLVAFALGMVLFTVVMGNAFAAFPVMLAGIGLPLLVLQHGADPAILGAIGMLTGYCGTLLTPMAANFNIVPAVLLELPDQYGVIRAQVPTALVLLAVNFALLWLLVFR
jgi:uncharacterized membrane protein